MNFVLNPAFIEGVGGGELLLVLVVALMLFGSKNLPGIFRTMGKTSEQMRKAVREVKDEIMRVDIEPLPPPTPLPAIKPAAHLQADDTSKEKTDEPAAG